MSKLKNNSFSFVFFGGRYLGYLCLEGLLDLGFIPELVICNPEDKGADEYSLYPLIKAHELKFHTFTELKKNPGLITQTHYDVGFSCFCSRIISGEVISSFHHGISNLHFSDLPKYRGQFPTVHALANGDKETAVTLHWIIEEADLGKRIKTEKVPISSSETGLTLFEKCVVQAEKTFLKFVGGLNEGVVPSGAEITPDPNSPVNQHLPNEGQIDLSWEKEKIERYIRAFSYPPHHGANFKVGDKEFKIIEA